MAYFWARPFTSEAQGSIEMLPMLLARSVSVAGLVGDSAAAVCGLGVILCKFGDCGSTSGWARPPGRLPGHCYRQCKPVKSDRTEDTPMRRGGRVWPDH